MLGIAVAAVMPMYNKRQYARVAELFEESIRLQPDHYMAYRSLAIACFSHLNRREEAPALMEKARALNCTQQILYESAVLMDLMGADPAEKIALLAPRAATFRRDDLFVELAKAYNQSGQPEKALATWASSAMKENLNGKSRRTYVPR